MTGIGRAPELQDQVASSDKQLSSALEGELPACPGCGRADYLPLRLGWRHCWACGTRWGRPGSRDPGDPDDVASLAELLGLRWRQAVNERRRFQ